MSVESLSILEEKNKTPFVLYVSGTPGAGKTSVINYLASQTESSIVPEFLEAIPDWVINTRADDSLERRIEAQRWTLHQHILKTREIQEREGVVFVDRTWIDSLLYATLYGAEVVESVYREAQAFNWTPGRNVLLTARPETTKARLQERMGITDVDWRNKWKPFVSGLHQQAQEIGRIFNIKVIDTSNMPIPEVAMECLI